MAHALAAQAPPGAGRDAVSPEAPEAHPLVVTRRIQQALEADSLQVVARQWAARSRQNPGDRLARFALATIARLRYDYQTADAAYRSLFLNAPADSITAIARIDYGKSLLVRNDLPAARAQTDSGASAARAARDRMLEGAAYVELGLLRALTGGMKPGLAAVDTALRLLPVHAVELRTFALARRADLMAVSGDPAAEGEAAVALREAARARSRGAMAAAYRAAGKGAELRGETDRALAYYDSTTAILRAARDRASLGVVLLRVAGIRVSRGEFGEAKRLMHLARVEAEASREGVVLGSSDMGLGAAALNLRDYRTAHDYLSRAHGTFVGQGDPMSAYLARYYLAMIAHRRGDHALARREIIAVADSSRKYGDTESLFQALRSVATVAIAQGDRRGATGALADARALAVQLGMTRWLGELRDDEGRLALSRGDFSRAERLLTTSAAGADSLNHLQLYDTRTRLAEALARQGKLAKAERELTVAADALDRYRAALGDRELRLFAFQATALERDDPVASFAWALNAIADGGRAPAAFALAARRRARELADAMQRAAALRRGGGVAGDTTRAIGGVDASTLAASLPPGTALLEYVAGHAGSPTTLFRVTRDQVTSHTLPPGDSLTERVRTLVTLLEAGDDPRALSRRLGSELLDDAIAGLPATITRLVIVPDGVLHRVPFDALRMADGRFIIERFAVAVAPSASVATSLWRERLEDVRPMRLLALGDPVFSPGDTSSGANEFRSGFAASGGLPRLAASGREARLVGRYAPESELRLRAEAAAEYVRRTRLDGYRVLHFATHAVVDDQSLTGTALALSPTVGDPGFLTPGDLAALTLDADMVVLSACRSAGGVVVGGEGVHGLTAALLQAGARSVVSTAWRVRDEGIVPMVDGLYRELARGKPLGDALRDAKVAAIARGAPPAEWAAFQVIGNPMVRVPLREPRWHPPTPLAAGAGIVLLVVAGIYGARTMKRRASDRRSVPSPA